MEIFLGLPLQEPSAGNRDPGASARTGALLWILLHGVFVTGGAGVQT